MMEPTDFQRETAWRVLGSRFGLDDSDETLERMVAAVIEAMQAQAAEDTRQRDAARAYATDTLAALGRVIEERDRYRDRIVDWVNSWACFTGRMGL